MGHDCKNMFMSNDKNQLIKVGLMIGDAGWKTKNSEEITIVGLESREWVISVTGAAGQMLLGNGVQGHPTDSFEVDNGAINVRCPVYEVDP